MSRAARSTNAPFRPCAPPSCLPGAPLRVPLQSCSLFFFHPTTGSLVVFYLPSEALGEGRGHWQSELCPGRAAATRCPGPRAPCSHPCGRRAASASADPGRRPPCHRPPHTSPGCNSDSALSRKKRRDGAATHRLGRSPRLCRRRGGGGSAFPPPASGWTLQPPAAPPSQASLAASLLLAANPPQCCPAGSFSRVGWTARAGGSCRGAGFSGTVDAPTLPGCSVWAYPHCAPSFSSPPRF